MSYRKLTKQQRAAYRALRELGGVITVTPDTARPLRALARRGLVRYSRDEHGVRLALLRNNRVTARTARRMKAVDTMYRALSGGACPFIPEIERAA